MATQPLERTAMTVRVVLAASVAMVLGGCSALTTMYDTPGDHPRTRPLPVAGTELFDWKGVVHCHCYLSHDSEGPLADIDDACRAARMDFVIMTDHQSEASIRDGARGMRGETLFMVGAELNTPQGTLQAFPLQTPLRRRQHAGLVIKDAAAQGAITLLCHAENNKAWPLPGLAGVEIVNLHAGAYLRTKGITLLTGLLLPARFLFERICYRDPGIFAHWDEQLQKRHPFTPVGGNDAHANVHVFGPLGGTIGTYREIFLTLSTHVLARHLDEASIIEAIKLGRTYVAYDIFGEGAGFDFRAVDPDGVHVGGATVRASSYLRLQVRTPAVGMIELWRDGVMVRAQEGEVMEVEAPAVGVYRVEVKTLFGSPWLFSSSIRVVE